MNTTNGLLGAAMLGLLATGAAAQQDSGVKAVGSVRDVMIGIIQPSSKAVFVAAADTPQKAEEWTAVENNALTLAESANLLMIGGRARDNAAWAKWSTALRDTSEGALKAARAKDAGALETTGDEVYQTCEGCHKIYVPGAVVN